MFTVFLSLALLGPLPPFASEPWPSVVFDLDLDQVTVDLSSLLCPELELSVVQPSAPVVVVDLVVDIPLPVAPTVRAAVLRRSLGSAPRPA